MAASFVEQSGVTSMIVPVELNEKEIKKLKLRDSELIVYGKIPLMITANCIDKSTKGCHSPNSAFTTLKDRKNARLPVLTCCRYCYNLVYNSVPIYLADKNIIPDNYNISFIGIVFSDENENDVRNIMDNVIQGRQADFEFTRGHFTRGVE
jgi:putative protease